MFLAYLQTGYYNVIGVDWSVLCETEYLSALRGVRLAGETLAKFMNWLNDMGVPFSEIHIIGHSLGAHVAGVAGDKLGGGKVGRITGISRFLGRFQGLYRIYFSQDWTLQVPDTPTYQKTTD